MAAIEVSELFMSYRNFVAVRGISFTVREGEVFALLGPNGAGKTTTLEILEGHRSRSGGGVSVLGFDPQEGGRHLRDRIGIVLQSAGIDGELTVREVLRLYAGCYARSLPPDELIALVGLQEKRGARVKTLSGGQRRRLDLALALVGDPELIFLDEPTIGFDPAARRGAWELIRGLRGMGRTIVLTSHYMDEVHQLADRMIVLSEGRIVASGSPASLSEAAGRTFVRFTLPEGQRAQELPAELRSLAISDQDEVVLITEDPTRTLLALTSWAVAGGVELGGLQASSPSLEEVYLQLTESENEKA